MKVSNHCRFWLVLGLVWGAPLFKSSELCAAKKSHHQTKKTKKKPDCEHCRQLGHHCLLDHEGACAEEHLYCMNQCKKGH